jgi:hypothetical protein
MMTTLFNQIGEREKATKKGKINTNKAVTVHKIIRDRKGEEDNQEEAIQMQD